MSTHTYVYYIPHPDDEVLSMSLHAMTMYARGNDIHFVFMSRGGTTGARNLLNGSASCGLHGWVHNPAKEFYDGATLDTAEIGASRLAEAKTALGLMTSIPTLGTNSPYPPIPAGTVTFSESGLGDSYGHGALPPNPADIDAVEQVMRDTIAQFPNAFHYTMSESDQQPDHAVCGAALRRLKNSADLGPSLTGAQFFVSRLYWMPNNGGVYPAPLRAVTNGGATLSFFDSVDVGPRYAEICSILRNHVIKAYNAWNPADGSFAIGYHSVKGQFDDCFGPTRNIACLMHP